MLIMRSMWGRWAESRRARARQRAEQPLRATRSLPVTTLAVVVVLGGGALAMWLLGVWSTIPTGVPDPNRLRLERIKTGLTVAAGLAAGVTLLMTLRRQAWSEQAQQFTQSDALEQRITALYVAAAEQVGSDKAAVRLAGLYALERLGQDNVKLRQTVVDVLCAYLRMPYTPPVEVLRRNDEGSPQKLAANAQVPEPEDQPRRREELQVRLAAQRLLTNHLRFNQQPDMSEPEGYWRGPACQRMNLNLAGAVLVGFGLAGCRAGRVELSGAHFHGRADLNWVHFSGGADMSGAHFYGPADLGMVQFHGGADMSGTHFHGHANLREVHFHARADLREVHFHGHADLGGAQFHVPTDLGGAHFHGRAELDGADFNSYADLRKVHFHARADLDGAKFHGHADLGGAQFDGAADISPACFRHSVNLQGCRLATLQPLPAPWAVVSQGPDGLWVVGRIDDESDLAGETGSPDEAGEASPT
ncbi:pentapeptide repeat-containing protein [Micromonospora sp. IBHARD004]|uniref:pentapeptide repeat-containing protein n=1 Tax=Micromonospora sp. IBHARD004 TaxID=3457764 RepID=UPI004057EA67